MNWSAFKCRKTDKHMHEFNMYNILHNDFFAFTYMIILYIFLTVE